MNGFTVVGYVVVSAAYMVSVTALTMPVDDETESAGLKIFRLAIGCALVSLYVLVLNL